MQLPKCLEFSAGVFGTNMKTEVLAFVFCFFNQGSHFFGIENTSSLVTLGIEITKGNKIRALNDIHTHAVVLRLISCLAAGYFSL